MEGKKLLDWIKRNYFTIIVCLAAVLACLLIYNNSTGLIEQCNQHHIKQFEAAHCSKYYQAYNATEGIQIDIKGYSPDAQAPS